MVVTRLIRIVTCLLLTIPALSLSEDWIPEVDRKYAEINPELFTHSEKARKLIDAYAGDTAILEAASNHLEIVFQNDDKFAPAYRQAARLALRAGYVSFKNYREGTLEYVEQLLRASIQFEPEYAEAYIQLANIYGKEDKLDLMQQSLLKAGAIGTEDPWLHYFWAEYFKKSRSYDEALSRFQAVIDANSPNRNVTESAMSGMIKIYRQLDRNLEANSLYLRLLQLDPTNAWTWGNYSSFLLYTMEDADKAVITGEKALSLMDYGMGRFTTACALYTKWAYARQNNEQEAEKYFQRAFELYPDIEVVIRDTASDEYTAVTARALLERSDIGFSMERVLVSLYEWIRSF